MNFISMNNHAVLKEIGLRIRRERLNQNTTQEALAGRAGVSRRVVLDLDKANKNPLCVLRDSAVKTILQPISLDFHSIFAMIPDN